MAMTITAIVFLVSAFGYIFTGLWLKRDSARRRVEFLDSIKEKHRFDSTLIAEKIVEDANVSRS